MDCKGTHYCTVHPSNGKYYVGVSTATAKPGPILDSAECCKNMNRRLPGRFQFYEIGTRNKMSGIKGALLENELKSNSPLHQGRYPITKIVV